MLRLGAILRELLLAAHQVRLDVRLGFGPLQSQLRLLQQQLHVPLGRRLVDLRLSAPIVESIQRTASARPDPLPSGPGE